MGAPCAKEMSLLLKEKGDAPKWEYAASILLFVSRTKLLALIVPQVILNRNSGAFTCGARHRLIRQSSLRSNAAPQKRGGRTYAKESFSVFDGVFPRNETVVDLSIGRSVVVRKSSLAKTLVLSVTGVRTQYWPRRSGSL